MRQAIRPTVRQQVNAPQTVPAPISGLNAIQPLAAMDPSSASILDNWFCEPTHLRPRRGYVSHGQFGTSTIETLATWAGPASQKLFGIGGGTLAEFTSGSPGGSLLTGLSNARFQKINFANTGGNWLLICNGSDGPYKYDGSNWSVAAITADGFGGESFETVTEYKGRLWFSISGTTQAAFLEPDSIQGQATSFEVGQNFNFGGYLQAVGTWMIDSQAGPLDLLCFISSNGEVAIYNGTDPTQASGFSRVGVFKLGPPIGPRCFTRVGADLAVITIDGVVPLSQAIKLDEGAVQKIVLMNKIAPLINADARLYKSNFGWQLIGYPKGTMAILNVPMTEGQTSRQYVMNTNTGAATRWTNINAACWETMNDRIFFGGPDGKVFEYDIGSRDLNEPIVTDMRGAFNFFGSRGQVKQFNMIRPMMVTSGPVTIGASLDIDFSNNPPAVPATAAVSAGPKWNRVKWNQFQWGGGTKIQNNWQAAAGIGYCAAPRIRTSTASSSNVSLWDDTFVWDQSRWDQNDTDDITLELHSIDVGMATGGML